MKMNSAGAGLGVGVKDYRVIFVFATDEALTQFLDSGWSGSAQTIVAANAGKTAQLTRELSRLRREYGSIRSPRMASPCS